MRELQVRSVRSCAPGVDADPHRRSCAILARTATTGMSLADAIARMVAIEREVKPDPAWTELYARMTPIHAELADRVAPLFDMLDRLGG